MINFLLSRFIYFIKTRLNIFAVLGIGWGWKEIVTRTKQMKKENEKHIKRGKA